MVFVEGDLLVVVVVVLFRRSGDDLSGRNLLLLGFNCIIESVSVILIQGLMLSV